MSLLKRLRCHLWMHQYEMWDHPNTYWDDIIEEWACVWCEAEYLESWRFRFWQWVWNSRLGEWFTNWLARNDAR